MKLKMKAWLGATLSACLCFSVGVGVTNIAIAEETTEESYFNRISTTVSEINNENLDSGNAFVMVLSATDFMTATEWSNQDYKWLNAEEILTFEDRANIDTANNNVCNAQLDQNLSDYNFEEYILIDGISLSERADVDAKCCVGNLYGRGLAVEHDIVNIRMQIRLGKRLFVGELALAPLCTLATVVP